MMQATYEVRIYDNAGDLLDVLTSWKSLYYRRRLRHPGEYVLMLRHTYDKEWPLDAIIEVWRTVSGQRYCDFVALHRTWRYELTEGGERTLASRGGGLLELVNRRRILYYGTTPYTLKAGPGETVIKEFVEENLGPSAISPPRRTDGVLPWVRVAPDLARGEEWFGHRPWENLLDVLNDVSLATGTFYKMHRPDKQVFEFTMLTPVERPQVFTEDFNNLLAYDYSYSRADETTVVAALGPEHGRYRHVVVERSARVNDSPWNTIETTASGDETYSGLLSAAETEMARGEPHHSLTASINQAVYRAVYGIDYDLGDIVQARIRGQELSQRVVEVGATINQTGREIIHHAFESP